MYAHKSMEKAVEPHEKGKFLLITTRKRAFHVAQTGQHENITS